MINSDLNQFKSTQEAVILPAGHDGLQWANSRDLSRIWDCGKTRWEFKV